MREPRPKQQPSGKDDSKNVVSKSEAAKSLRAKTKAIPPEPPPQNRRSEPRPDQSKTVFSIVGIGASAGGLEAFTELLSHLPTDTGFAFVLVQHLDPLHESSLTQILARATTMPVREVSNNLKVEANHVYVIPPNTNLDIARGVLKLHPRPRTRAPTRSIDSFFESLARDQRNRAIGVILSGTATDGTLGLEAIRAEGGITFAQDDSARYDSMPRSAVAAGCVDLVFNPEGIAKELARIATHPYVADQRHEFLSAEDDRKSPAILKDNETSLRFGEEGGGTGTKRTSAEDEPAKRDSAENGYQKILLLLRHHCGVDFSLYKSTTIKRRITRRMVLSKQDEPEQYAQFLKGNVKELEALYSDVLIGVTGFFRNPEAFDVLKRKVFPQLLQQRGDDPLRIWTLGCSTGQEAYSIAMAFMESAENAPRARKLQIFATDLNDATLEKARHGLYAKTVAQDISPERLRRFFVEEEGGYRIVKSLREMVVFARQNLIADPPFSRIDLISCRNLLIYLEPSLQKRAFPTFHYALKPGGYLFLGASESVGSFTQLFEPLDKKQKIFSRKNGPTPPFYLPTKSERTSHPAPRSGPTLAMGKGLGESFEGVRSELNAEREADRVTVNEFAPPGVLVNAELQILQFRGRTDSFLQAPPTGKANFDLLKMAREGLMLPLRAAINQAKKENKTSRAENVQVKENGKTSKVNVEVVPLRNLRERCFLILFEMAEKGGVAQFDIVSAKQSSSAAKRASSSQKEAPQRVAHLEHELSDTRDFLQSIQEQHEAANEELQASNEEVQSANEELQSINEELETSKEELESANEELTTVNEEMTNRNSELNRANADLNNLQASTKLPILLLGRDLTIRRFSHLAEKIFNLLAADVGRPVSGIRHNLVGPLKRTAPRTANNSQEDDEDAVPVRLDALVREVIDTVRESEEEVRDKEGRWYSLRVRPYMTLDNKVDGAVLVLVDIHDLKRTEEKLKAARDYAEATIRTSRDPLVVLRSDLRVNTANEAFYKVFHTTPDQTEGRLIFELSSRAWDLPKLRTLLKDIIPRNSFFNDFEVTKEFPFGRRTVLLNARRLDHDHGAPPMILLAIEDVTERMRADAAVAALASIVNSSDHAIIGKDLNGVITSWNQSAERLFGYTAVEAIGQPITILIPPERHREETEILARLKRGETVDHMETIRLRKNGSRVDISLTSSPIKDATGKVIGASKIARDITEVKMASERVRVSEIRYRRLFEAAHDGVLILDPVSRKITDSNPFITKLLGYSQNGLLGKELWEIGLLKDEQASHLAFRELQQKGQIRYQDLPLQSQSGEKREVEVVANLYEEDGQQVIQCNIRDITERKKVEEELAEKARLLDLSNDAIIVRNLEDKISLWNKGAEKLYGWTCEEVIGKHLHSLLRTEFPKPMEQILSQLRREGHYRGEVVQIARDGRRIPSLCRWVLDRKTASILTSYTDISERKRTEEALRESEERYRTLFDLSPVAVYTIDTAGVIQNFNRHAAGLWGREPAPGDTDQRFCGSFRMFRPDGSFMPHEQCPMAEVVSGKVSAVHNGEVHIERADGSRVTVIVNINPLKNDRGEVIGAINCFYDITERKQAEDALRQAQAQLADRAGQLEHAVTERTLELTATNKQLEAFVYSIAHDLRAPLRAMQGYSSLLVEDVSASVSEVGKDLARRIDRSAQFMDALLKDLLTFSRVSQERLVLRAVDLGGVAENVLSRLEKDIQEKNARIETTGPWPTVLAHERTVEQVLFNLVSNAMKFGSPEVQPVVRLRTEERLGRIRVWVEDNGIGIAPEYLEQVFRLFTRLHGEKYPGTGIGLTIVQKGVERMGGGVGVDSVLGQGSRFWFELRKPE